MMLSTERISCHGRRTAIVHSRRGTAAVEFALVAPLLALLVVGMFEVGRALIVKASLEEAARAGCQTGTLPLRDNAAIISDVHGVLRANSISPGDVTITIQVNNQSADVATASANDKISVRVDIPYRSVSWTSGFFFMKGDVVQSETIVMMRQG